MVVGDVQEKIGKVHDFEKYDRVEPHRDKRGTSIVSSSAFITRRMSLPTMNKIKNGSDYIKCSRRGRASESGEKSYHAACMRSKKNHLTLTYLAEII